MITERQFAQLFHSFWQPFLPGSRLLLKRLNQTASQFAEPIAQTNRPGMRAISSEFGFRLFALRSRGELAGELLSTNEQITSVGIEAARYVWRFRTTTDSVPENEAAIVAEVFDDAVLECAQLERFTSNRQRLRFRLEVQPKIPGCGIVEASTADLLIADTLYEVKSRSGTFEQVDLRQLLTYAILSYVADEDRIRYIGFVNPHLGKTVEVSLESAIFSLGKVSVAEFAALAETTWTTETMSR